MKKNQLIALLFALLAAVYYFFLRGNQAQRLAKRFCQCSGDLARPEQLKAQGRAPGEDEYQRLRQVQIDCMGGAADPRTHLTPEQAKAFDKDFLLEIRRLCPQTGRALQLLPDEGSGF